MTIKYLTFSVDLCQYKNINETEHSGLKIVLKEQYCLPRKYLTFAI